MSDFWSKRKAAVEAATDAELAEAHEATLEASTAEKTDAEILDELGLPDPDNMKEGDFLYFTLTITFSLIASLASSNSTFCACSSSLSSSSLTSAAKH